MPKSLSPLPPEIVQQGRRDDPEIIDARNEPDYHLMESGSDVVISDKAKEVPEPAPYEKGMIGATTGTRMHIPETDILDSSSCSSDTEDDVVKICDSEAPGNSRGINRRFTIFNLKVFIEMRINTYGQLVTNAFYLNY